MYKPLLGLFVIVCAEQVHCLEQLMRIDQRTNTDQCAQDAPAPEGTCTKGVGNISALQLIANSIGDVVIPHKRSNAQSQPGNNKSHQTVMHCLFAVVLAGDQVDVG